MKHQCISEPLLLSVAVAAACSVMRGCLMGWCTLRNPYPSSSKALPDIDCALLSCQHDEEPGLVCQIFGCAMQSLPCGTALASRFGIWRGNCRRERFLYRGMISYDAKWHAGKGEQYMAELDQACLPSEAHAHLQRGTKALICSQSTVRPCVLSCSILHLN
jgi:hypothetical protein